MAFKDATDLMSVLKRQLHEARVARDYPKADRMAHRIKVLRAYFKKAQSTI